VFENQQQQMNKQNARKFSGVYWFFFYA